MIKKNKIKKYKRLFGFLFFCIVLFCVGLFVLFNMFGLKKTSPQELLRNLKADYLLVSATNKWLDETADLKESSVYTLTGFTGDTGYALLSKNGEITLIVDGRYHIQADNEVKNGVKVVKLQTGQKFNKEIANNIYKGSTLVVVSSKTSAVGYKILQKYLDARNIKVVIVKQDPINDFSVKTSKKFKKVDYEPKKLLLEKNTLITNPDDVSYLTGLRNFDKEGSSKIYAKLFIDKQGRYTLFTNQKKLEKFIDNINKTDEEIVVDQFISLYDFNLIKKPLVLSSFEIPSLKSTKTNDEIVDLKKAFEISDKALLATRKYIEKSKSGSLSEYDIYKKLVKEFYKNGAYGLSFEPIVAINQNSAQAHYNKHSKDVYLRDGDLVLIDCGVYGKNGLATDTTRVFVKGQPSKLQKQVYTLVLKAFLNAYKHHEMNGYELNELAHRILDNKIDKNGLVLDIASKQELDSQNSKNNGDFFVFNHGLGHGIGVSVHEYPPALSKYDGAKQPLLNNMCFTIEPGLYHKDFFGIRLENSFYRKEDKNISFVKVGFENKLIYFDLLTQEEMGLLTQFGVI